MRLGQLSRALRTCVHSAEMMTWPYLLDHKADLPTAIWIDCRQGIRSKTSSTWINTTTMSTAAPVAAVKASSGSFLSFLYSPSIDINYSFICLVYVIGSVLCIALYVMDAILKVRLHLVLVHVDSTSVGTGWIVSRLLANFLAIHSFLVLGSVHAVLLAQTYRSG